MKILNAGLFLLLVLLAVPIVAADQIENFSPINRDRLVPQVQEPPGTPQVQLRDDPLPYYTGELRVYVVEHESSMGWTSGGNLYDFPFLAYAIKSDFLVLGQTTWDTTVTWDGSVYNYNVQEDNIAVQAVIFSHQSGLPEAAAMADPGVPGTNVTGSGYTHTVFAEEGTATW